MNTLLRKKKTILNT